MVLFGKRNIRLHSSEEKKKIYELLSPKQQLKHATWMIEKHQSQKKSMIALQYTSALYCGGLALCAVTTVATFGIAGPICFGSWGVASAGCHFVSRKNCSKKREQQFKWRMEKKRLKKKLNIDENIVEIVAGYQKL